MSLGFGPRPNDLDFLEAFAGWNPKAPYTCTRPYVSLDCSHLQAGTAPDMLTQHMLYKTPSPISTGETPPLLCGQVLWHACPCHRRSSSCNVLKVTLTGHVASSFDRSEVAYSRKLDVLTAFGFLVFLNSALWLQCPRRSVATV